MRIRKGVKVCEGEEEGAGGVRVEEEGEEEGDGEGGEGQGGQGRVVGSGIESSTESSKYIK